MKPFFSIVLSFMLILSLCACSAPAFSVPESSGAAPLQPDASSSGSLAAKTVTLTDSGGESVQIPENPRVVSLYGSYSEAWLLAGGSLVGVTQDAVDERGLDVGGAQVVGTVKEPSAEA
ncbi:MAG: ABC transporter substrate-binding protein, partial [Acutalibacter sp.]|nr:ABC transporter substrate-binding protein [Acutalibacter sp.]